MTDIKILVRHLAQISRLLPELGALNASLLGLHALAYDLGGKTPPTANASPIEKGLLEREERVGLLTQLADIAVEWGWSGKEKMAPATWMAMHIGEVEKQYGTIPEDQAETIIKVSTLLARLIVKPTRVERSRKENIALLKLRAQNYPEEIWITKKEFQKTFQIPGEQIRQWVREGKLTENLGEEIDLKQALELIS